MFFGKLKKVLSVLVQKRFVTFNGEFPNENWIFAKFNAFLFISYFVLKKL